MATITFDPPASMSPTIDGDIEYTGLTIYGMFGITDDDNVVVEPPRKWHRITSISHDKIPCDLTLDPTRPEMWPKAVYEAGKRDGIAEHVLVFGGPSPAHPSVEAEYGRGYIRDVMGGVAQQPAKATNGMIEGFDMRPPRPSDAFDTNVRCKVCGEHDAHETMEPGFYDGREVTFVHKKCNKPPAKTLEQRVADLEARFPGELQDGC